MTTQNEAAEAIAARFAASWTTPYHLGNENFTPPEGAPWARLTVIETASNAEGIGNVGSRNMLRTGRILVDVFTPADEGTQESDALCALARSLFEMQRFSGVICIECTVQTVGLSGAWFQRQADTRFQIIERI